jgi:hypothetical protein
LKIYPNPATQQFIIDLKLNDENLNEPATIEVSNSLGQLVYSTRSTINNGTVHCEINSEIKLSNGNYMVRVIAGNVVLTGRFIMQE